MKQIVVSKTTSRLLYFLLAALCWLPGVFLLFLGSPKTAHAQPALPLRLSIEAGFDGYYRMNQWFPVVVVASNDGPDIQGILEWRFPGGSNQNLFQRPIDLPRGARKRLTLSVLSEDFARIGEVRIVTGRVERIKQQIQLSPIDSDQFAIGVVSSDTTLLNSLSAMQMVNTTVGSTVIHIQPDMIPESALSMSSLNALFIHDITTANLNKEQISALKLWVLLGGQLVVSGGASAEKSTSGLADMLPVTVGELEKDVPLTPLQAYIADATTQQRDTIPNGATVNRVELHDSAKALDQAQMITTHNYGEGYVIFSAFDLSELRSWLGEVPLWAQVLHAEARFKNVQSLGVWGSLLRTVLQMPSLQIPSFGTLFFLMLAYILLIGPINFLVLRRFNRVELAWRTIPAIVLIFVVGTYGASFVVRGTKPELFQLSIVQSFEGHEQGLGTIHLGVFSPRRKSYSFQFAPDSLIRTQESGERQATSSFVWSDTTAEVQDLLVDVSSLRDLVIEQPIAKVPQVQSSIQQRQGKIWGTLQNQNDEPLHNALLVYGNSVVPLGTIAPRSTVDVEIERDMFNFPDNAGTGREGTFDRQQILSNLFQQHNTMVEDQPQQDVYVLAWREQPLLDVQTQTDFMKEQYLTLYIIRLKDG
jgi:hypothetical protein